MTTEVRNNTEAAHKQVAELLRQKTALGSIQDIGEEIKNLALALKALTEAVEVAAPKE